MIPKIDWDNLFKVRIASSDPSMQKHEVLKLLLVMKLLNKNRKRKSWIRIYTEFELENGCKPDVYFEDVQRKEAMAYEIQKEMTKEWQGRKAAQYKDWEVPFFNSSDLITIPLKEFSDNIVEMDKQLEQYIF